MNDATNRNEKKIDNVGSENINDKLSSAAKVIDDARAEARARLAQERRTREAQEKSEKARASEMEAKSRENEKRIESAMAKKRAESEYAESSRRSTEIDKRRARAFADTEAVKKEIEKENRLREESAKREREELMRRNAASDSLLSSVNRRVEESKNAAKARMSEEAELKRILFAAQVAKNEVKAEQKREEKELLEVEEARRRASEEALEEQRALKLAEEARIRLEAAEKDASSVKAELSEENESKTPASPDAPLINEKAASPEQSKQEKNIDAGKIGEIIVQDGIEFIRGIPEEKPKDDNVTVIDGIEFIRGIPEVNLTRPLSEEENKNALQTRSPKSSSEATLVHDKSAEAEQHTDGNDKLNQDRSVESISIVISEGNSSDTVKNPVTEEKKETESRANEAPRSDEKAKSAFDSILGSTYSMMTAKTGLEEKYEKKREIAESAIRSSDDTYLPHTKASEYEEPKFKYDYDAGYIIKPEDTAKKRKKGKKDASRKMKGEVPELISVPKEDTDIRFADEVKKAEENETKAPDTVISLDTGNTFEGIHNDDNFSPSDARLQALLEEKQRKEREIALLEAQSKKETEALREKNRRAKAEYLSAQYSVREEEYRRDIMALNSRIRDIENERAAVRDYYESSYSVYGSGVKETINTSSALSEDVTPASVYDLDRELTVDPDKNDTPCHRDIEDVPYSDKITKKNGKHNVKKRKAEKDDLYNAEEFSRRNERRAILDDYKAYNEKYGEGSRKKLDSEEYAPLKDDRDAELKRKYAKYFADEEEPNSYVQPTLERKTDSVYPIIEDTVVNIYHEPAPVSKDLGPETVPSGDSKRSAAELSESEDFFVEDAEDITDVKAMKRRELSQHLKSTLKAEKKLKRAVKQEERKYAKTSATEKPEKLIDVMSAKRELFNLYTSNYMLCTVSSDKKDARLFGKSAKLLVKDYNRDLSSYEKLTAKAQEHVENPVEYIKKHGTPPTLPLPKAEKGAQEEEAKTSRKAQKREQLAFAKNDLENQRKDKRMRKDAYTQAKQRIENDEQTVAARIDYRINKYDYEITRGKFRFGEETGADRRTRKRTLAKLKAMRNGRKSAIKREAENNARYLEVATADPRNAKRKRGVKASDLRDVSERVSLLLTERDGINRRLNSLYRENESVFSASKNSRKQITELKLSVARRVFKSQLKEYRRVSKYPIPLKDKQPLYDAMNDKIELSSTKAEFEYRLKSERPKGEIRAEMRERLREVKADIRRTDKAIPRLRKKITARVKRTDRPKNQFVWLLVLLLVAALVTVALVFFKDQILALFNSIWDFAMGLFKKNG